MRKIFYIDVSQMSRKEAEEVLNRISGRTVKQQSFIEVIAAALTFGVFI